ncbi:MAG: GNAT family N-acetyltransferase [Verrucomicrobiota bacterium]
MFDEGLLPEPAVAETLLDLLVLQRIGVKLVVVVSGGEIGDLNDWAVEMEFRSELIEGELVVDDLVGSCRAVLERGQAALVDGRGVEVLGAEVGELARDLGAAKLMVLLSEKPLETLPAIRASEVRVGSWLEGAAVICGMGVPRVHLLDGHFQGVLTAEIFSNEGVGTMVHADDYRRVRGLGEDDIPELLAMMGRSVRAAHLVPRTYEEIEEKVGDFLVMTLDENVVGSVAVHEYEGHARGEVACLYVKLSHESHGYGGGLLEAAEAKAREMGLKGVFALTNRAADFFASRGYRQGGFEDLPLQRREQLKASGRDSQVWVKDF